MAVDRNSLNKAMIVGHVGADPEIRYTSNQTPVVNLSVATNTSTQDQEGNRQDQTEWHRANLFGRLAEIAQNYVRKGSMVYVEGRLQTREYTDRDGNTRYSTEILAATMTLLGGRGSGDDSGQSAAAGAATQSSPATNQAPAEPTQQTQQPDASEPDDDLPF
jgi:single stranded DNA-binding protein (ssb)